MKIFLFLYIYFFEKSKESIWWLKNIFKNFYKNVSMEKINILISKHFFPSDKNLYLYDFAFFNNMFEECQYHPSPQCKLKWTDEVLLPELTRLGLVEKVYSKWWQLVMAFCRLQPLTVLITLLLSSAHKLIQNNF